MEQYTIGFKLTKTITPLMIYVPILNRQKVSLALKIKRSGQVNPIVLNFQIAQINFFNDIY